MSCVRSSILFSPWHHLTIGLEGYFPTLCFSEYVLLIVYLTPLIKVHEKVNQSSIITTGPNVPTLPTSYRKITLVWKLMYNSKWNFNIKYFCYCLVWLFFSWPSASCTLFSNMTCLDIFPDYLVRLCCIFPWKVKKVLIKDLHYKYFVAGIPRYQL